MTTNVKRRLILALLIQLVAISAFAQVEPLAQWNFMAGFQTSGPIRPATDNAVDLGTSALRWRHIFSGRMVTGASTPTVDNPAATGTGGTTAVNTGSSDYAGSILITAGTTAAATGVHTVTFSTNNGAYGTNPPVVVVTLVGANWNARASLRVTAVSTTSFAVTWDNNAVALTSTSTYQISYVVVGR